MRGGGLLSCCDQLPEEFQLTYFTFLGGTYKASTGGKKDGFRFGCTVCFVVPMEAFDMDSGTTGCCKITC